MLQLRIDVFYFFTSSWAVHFEEPKSHISISYLLSTCYIIFKARKQTVVSNIGGKHRQRTFHRFGSVSICRDDPFPPDDARPVAGWIVPCGTLPKGAGE